MRSTRLIVRKCRVPNSDWIKNVARYHGTYLVICASTALVPNGLITFPSHNTILCLNNIFLRVLSIGFKIMQLRTISLATLSRPTRKINQPCSILFSIVRKLTMAYAVHEPLTKGEPHQPALIILHGLFGSKKNSSSVGRLAI